MRAKNVTNILLKNFLDLCKPKITSKFLKFFYLLFYLKLLKKLLKIFKIKSRRIINNILVFGVVIYWVCGFAFAYGKNKYKDDYGKYHYTEANAFIGTFL